MFIQNKSLANTDLAIRGVTVTGDASGIFDVSDEIGALLVETPGWSKSETGPVAPEQVDPVAALKALRTPEAAKPIDTLPPPPPPVVATPTGAQGVESSPEPEPEPDEDSDDDPDEGPDLESMGKKDLLAVAVEYGVQISAALKRGKVEVLREYLDKAIYGD